MKIFHNKSLNNFIPPIFRTYDVMEAYKPSELGMGVRFPLSLLHCRYGIMAIMQPCRGCDLGSIPSIGALSGWGSLGNP